MKKSLGYAVFLSFITLALQADQDGNRYYGRMGQDSTRYYGSVERDAPAKSARRAKDRKEKSKKTRPTKKSKKDAEKKGYVENIASSTGNVAKDTGKLVGSFLGFGRDKQTE